MNDLSTAFIQAYTEYFFSLLEVARFTLLFAKLGPVCLLQVVGLPQLKS